MYQNTLANISWGAPNPETPTYQHYRTGSEQGHDGDSSTLDENDDYAPLRMDNGGVQPTVLIEINRGKVCAILVVYETNDYFALVNEFGAMHHLTISPEIEFSCDQDSTISRFTQAATRSRPIKGVDGHFGQ
ncbi:hypothetical protein BC941DRAFT_466268 [Chlamydoabsidia padenii]|nr:hypothetical protein BC941DRAFT_466268 [Chlamydoabsidia padenii]